MRILLLVLLGFVLSGPGYGEERQAVVLMYHHFGVAKHPSTNVRLEQFEAHLEHLASGGYQVWPLARVVEHIQQDKPFPARVVAITVDDAYRSVYTEAFPRLRERGWPFTVFVATDGVDRRFKAYMSWEQMREMQQHGVTFANHTATHNYLVRREPGESEAQWRARTREDIQRAQRRLKEELGSALGLFAYPYGEYDTALANIVAEMGFVAFGQHSGPAGLGDDLRALPRFPMAESFAAIKDFRLKVASLAFPVEAVAPWDPVVASAQAPCMVVTLGESGARLGELSCFFPGEGRVDVDWLNREHRQFSVQASNPLPKGRSRYNCTAPSKEKGRFYWYSHLWLKPGNE